MNKGIISILVAVVLLGGAYFAYQSVSKPEESNSTNTIDGEIQSNNSQNESAQQNTAEPKTGKTTSLAQLSRQGAQECDLTITPPDQGVSYTGKFYTDGAGKFRSEIESGPNGGVYYLIVADQMFYNWSNQNNQGIKRQVDATTEAEYDAAINESDLSQTYDFDCSPWKVEASVLTPPANITFMDMAQMPTNPFQ